MASVAKQFRGYLVECILGNQQNCFFLLKPGLVVNHIGLSEFISLICQAILSAQRFLLEVLFP